ncbi:MAG: histidine--tRNA ligase [Pseudomonadota bacterium]
MGEQLRSIRGMPDLLPSDTSIWTEVERVVRGTLENYGFGEIRLPIIESTAVFARSIGDATDIVQKEMYSFEDRNGEGLTLRPEGTASCVRAVLQHNLAAQQSLKLWYHGPMFRYERPQRGRQRQFHQIGGEVFGLTGPDIDFELLLMLRRLWSQLHLEHIELQVNSLGDAETRKRYRETLVEYFHDHKDQLDEDSLRRLDANPLRILDSKNPQLSALIEGAPKLLDHLSDPCREHFQAVTDGLSAAGLEFTVNPHLVRGLDYYSRTVFEWVTSALGAQGTVCAGGRYDDLVALMGGKPTPAVGFAMGIERLVELYRLSNDTQEETADVFVLAAQEELSSDAILVAERIRNHQPHWRVLSHCGGGSLKTKFKKADRSGAKLAVILGADEWQQQAVSVKPLRNDGAQVQIKLAELESQIDLLIPKSS